MTLSAVAPAQPRGAGWAVVWRVEMTKLAGQARVRAAFALCVVGPVLFVAVMAVQPAVPADTLFGRWVHESGWAVAFAVLGFAGQWGLPVLVSIVAGDLCAEEDRLGTWSLLFTRSRPRSDVVAGKLLAGATYCAAVTVVLGVAAIVAGVVGVGDQPVVGLSGQLLSTGAALRAAVEAWLATLAPVLAIGAIAAALSAISRSSWVGIIVPVVVVVACNLIGLLSALDPVRPLLPTTGFDAWHGLARTDPYAGPIWTSLAVSAAWVAVGCAVTLVTAVRRDVTSA